MHQLITLCAIFVAGAGAIGLLVRFNPRRFDNGTTLFFTVLLASLIGTAIVLVQVHAGGEHRVDVLVSLASLTWALFLAVPALAGLALSFDDANQAKSDRLERGKFARDVTLGIADVAQKLDEIIVLLQK